VAAVALYSGSLVQRRRHRRGWGILLSSLGYGVVLLSSYLGGELVFEQGTAVNHAAWLGGSDEFTPVMDEAALQPDNPVRVLAGTTPVMLVRRGGTIHALAAVCTHAGGPLDEGKLADEMIICPWHGSRFSLEEGRVKGGPATMDEPTFDVRVRNGKIEVRRAASTH
jgi:nitrite reductase/ring-hydroxylating ferredoxin subunit